MATARPLHDLDCETRSSKNRQSDSADDEDSDEEMPSAENVLEFVGNRTSDSDMITVKIDLTDPEDLARKLELMDLTDAETDLIFDKATELNCWLREQLSRQSEGGDAVMNGSLAASRLQSSLYLVSAPAAAVTSDTESDRSYPGRSRRIRTYSGGSSTTLPPLPTRGSMSQASATYAAKQSKSGPALTSSLSATCYRQPLRPAARSLPRDAGLLSLASGPRPPYNPHRYEHK